MWTVKRAEKVRLAVPIPRTTATITANLARSSAAYRRLPRPSRAPSRGV